MLSPVLQSQNSNFFSGKITDSKLNPLSGASIFVLNTNISAITDAAGTFSIKNMPKGKYVIQAKALGFAGTYKEVNIANNSEITIILNEQANHLDDVIVTAQKKEEMLQKIPFSISAISSKEVSEYRLWNSREITAIIPNLYAANPGDNRNVISVRGITTTSYDPAVGC